MKSNSPDKQRRAAPVRLLAAAMLLSAFALAADPISLNYANFPPASTFPCVQMERWSQEVARRSTGAVQIKTFPGSSLLGAKNMLDGVAAGLADIGCFSPSYQPGRFPISEAVDLPIGFPSAKVASLAYLDLIDKYKPKELNQVKVLAVFTCPPVSFMTRTPVRSLDGLKGLELRVAGTGADVVKLLGGVPVAMPQSETPDALQKGAVKGIASSLEILKDFNFAEFVRYALVADTNVVSFVVAMNKDRWNALPAGVRKVMDDLRGEHSLWTGAYVDDHVKEALDYSKKTYDHQVFQLSAPDKAKLANLLKPMINDYQKRVSASGIKGAEVVKDLRDSIAKYQGKYR